VAQARGLLISVAVRRRLLPVTLAAGSTIILLSCWLAAKSPDENAALCRDSSPEVRIKACTVLILSGKEKTENLARAYYDRGLAYQSEEDYDRAIQDFDQAIRLKPKDTDFLTSRAYAYRHKGDYDRAIEDFNQAIRLRPDYLGAFMIRGDAYAKKKIMTTPSRITMRPSA